MQTNANSLCELTKVLNESQGAGAEVSFMLNNLS